jgi:malate/lactate dehydrogenase
LKVTVIGAAGSVGAPVAFHLAASRLAEEIVLIDVRPNLVQQHAMDMSTAVAALGVSVRAGDIEDLDASDVVINAAGMPQGVIADRMEMLSKNVPLARETAQKIRRHCPRAVVITATNPVDPLNYAIWRAGGFDRHQVLGYSLNDSLRFRELVARSRQVGVSSVEGTVIGEHGNTQVMLFSSVRIEGRATMFSETEKNGIRSEVPNILKRYEELKSGRTSGWTCAIGLAALVRAIREDSEEVFPCSMVLEGEYGQYGLSMSVPIALGRRGAVKIVEWELASDEKVELTRSAAVLAAAARLVDENLQY